MPRILRVTLSTRSTVRGALLAAMQLATLTALASVAEAQDTTAVARTRPAVSIPIVKDVPAPAPRTDSAAARAAAAKRVATAPTVTPAGAPAPAPAAAADAATPDLANAYVQRAVSLYELGKDEAALAEYRRGIANDPLDSDTWFGLADLLHELGRDKQAIETYTLALSTIEHAPELRIPFAELLMANKRKADAIKVLQKGIELDPAASADMKAMLGQVLFGVLDDTSSVVAPAAARAAATSPVAKATSAKPRARVKRKKLCNMFCPGTFDAAAPKP